MSHQNTPIRVVRSLALGLLAASSTSLVSAAYDPNYLFGLYGDGVFEPEGILMRDYTYATSVWLGQGSTHSPGTLGTIGTQIFGGELLSPESIHYSAHSVFAMDFNVTSDHVQTYDKVIYNGEISGSDAYFLVGFGNDIDYDATFWNLSRSWDNIFVKPDGTRPDLSKIFSGELISWAPAERGSFSFKGNALVWSPVPEPSTALAGVLLFAGILRRRRDF